MIFEAHAAVESYEASKKFFNCKVEEGSSVSEHVLKMSGHANKLQSLGIVIPNALGIYRVLQSLPPSYKNFVMNYNMQNMDKSLPELFSMLKSAEVEIKKVSLLLRLAFLEFGGLIDHQHLVLFLDLHFCRFQHGEEFCQLLVHALHIVVHHKVLVTWW